DELLLGDMRIVLSVGEPVVVEQAQSADSGPFIGDQTQETAPTSVSSPFLARVSSSISAPPPFAAPGSPGRPDEAPLPFSDFAVPGVNAEEVEVRDGARAVEVSAMFEEAVLDVRLFADPQAGRTSGITKGLLGFGSASLVASLVLLIVAFVQVGTLRRARDA